jgi:hypothetical protein
LSVETGFRIILNKKLQSLPGRYALTESLHFLESSSVLAQFASFLIN